MHGFTLLRDEMIEELNSRVCLYRHEHSGAELLSMSNAEENKVFGVTLRTPPPDSTGISHIMEHSVLCGSRKYPLREPFVELMKGSQATFLNAFTYPDKTCYPVASQNLQDFYNLVDVYLDAVFYPLISEQTLQQEGWHYDIESPKGEMAFKGVVYNEMKGAYSSPDTILGETLQHALYPDTCYGLDSGGDPAHIPNLTYAAFRDFHQRYYHPSNARLFFYGDDPEEKRLEILDEYLNGFPAIAVDSAVGLQARFASLRKTEEVYAVSEGEEGKAQVCLGWALAEGYRDPQTALGLAILNHILLATPASPLRKALIDSGLGEDLTGPGLDANYRQILFASGLKGVDPANREAVETVFLETLHQLAQEGIDPEAVRASLNTIEFRLRERNTGGWPRGLVVMLDALETWLYGGDVYAALRINEPFQEIRRLSTAGRYFEELIQTWLLDNPHRVTLTLLPDTGLASRKEEEEAARLSEARGRMSEAEIAEAVRITLELRERQETPDTPEALATIPVLRLADLEREIRRIPSRTGGDGAIRVHELDTNGIIYLDLGFDLHGLDQKLIPLLPLFARMLTESGTAELDFVRLMQRIGQNTGGLRAQLLFSNQREQKEVAAWLFLRGKAMANQYGELLAIIGDILEGARLDDRARFQHVLLENRASLEARLGDMGHQVVNSRLRAHYSEAGWLSESTSGVEQLFYLRRLEERLSQDWEEVRGELQELRKQIVLRAGTLANLTVDGAAAGEAEADTVRFLDTLPSGKRERQIWLAPVFEAAEGLSIPTQVNFVGKAFDLREVDYGAQGAALAVLQNLRTTWLWERVRVRGGAYGGLAAWDPYLGLLTFLSYRDPNLLPTLEIYDQTGEYFQELDVSQAELEKAIIGAVGDLDAYQLPDAKGFTSMVRELTGADDAWRQEYRTQLLNATASDFRRFGEALASAASEGRVVILSSAAALEKLAGEKPAWLHIQKAL